MVKAKLLKLREVVLITFKKSYTYECMNMLAFIEIDNGVSARYFTM